MGTQTTFRLRFPTRATEAAVRTALARLAFLPLCEARLFEDVCDEVGNVAPGVTISGLVPTEPQVQRDGWSLADGVLTFVGDLINARYRADYDNDGDPHARGGQTSRQDVLIEALQSVCAAEDGTIVGAWTWDHLDGWEPVVFLEGRLLRAYTGHRAEYSHRGPFLPHDGRLPVDQLEVDPDEGTVSIPAAAFAIPA